MLSTAIYRDTEVAAMRQIAKLCEEHNLEITWHTAQSVLEACCGERRIHVLASIRPSRECDGICLTVRSPLGSRILDGQDHQFLHPECAGHMHLDVYLTALCGEF